MTAPSTPAPFVTREDLLAKPTWTAADVGAFFDVSRDTLDRWRKNPRTGFPKARALAGGRVLRWEPSEVEAWYLGHEVAA